MNYATIKYYDIANGPGVRTSVFVSGCRHHRPGFFTEVVGDIRPPRGCVCGLPPPLPRLLQ